MAHVNLNNNVARGSAILSDCNNIRRALDNLEQHKQAMIAMLTGESSQAASFQQIAVLYGANGYQGGETQEDRNAAAKLMFDELNSAIGNLHGSLRQFLAVMG